ncbi:MAG TPA: SH3 domain-containing protein [Thermoanaerobaculia bacterium]
MKRSFTLLLFLTLACRESVAPDAGTTAANEAPATSSPAPVTPPPATPAASTDTATPAPAATGPKLMPVDEAPRDPSLVAYRNQLLAAIRSRDANAVAALVDPKIRTSFGDGGGAAEFRKALAREGAMEDLELVLSNGGTFLGDEARAFWAPYVYSAWPEKYDAFQSFAAMGPNVPLRESKNPNSPVVTTLSYDIVTQVMTEGDLRQVKTADGKIGWTEAKLLRSPIAHRAGFNKINGKWLMNAFVAGD